MQLIKSKNAIPFLPEKSINKWIQMFPAAANGKIQAHFRKESLAFEYSL